MKIARYIATASSLTAGGAVLFGSTESNSQAYNYSGAGGVQLKQPGTYLVIANFSTTATADGTEIITMYKGTTSTTQASQTVATGDIADLSLSDFVTVKPASSDYATVYFRTTSATTLSAGQVIVIKVV